ncbi:hypothetical protein MPER_02593, partial [Moniliophthora perniciosa FA553]
KKDQVELRDGERTGHFEKIHYRESFREIGPALCVLLRGLTGGSVPDSKECRELYSGEIDTGTGFALITSAQTCYVWQHALALKGTPTCYIFPCPWDYNQTEPPFHSLVPYGAGREPGLILLSATGEIRFWDSIGIGLAGGDKYNTTHLGLTSEELVTYLIRVD